jgi:hypothetical protein
VHFTIFDHNQKVFVYKSIYPAWNISICAGTAPASGPPSPTGKGAFNSSVPPGLAIDDNVYHR